MDIRRNTDQTVLPSNVHISILRGLECQLNRLRIKLADEPSIFADGDLAEPMKRSASDRLQSVSCSFQHP